MRMSFNFMNLMAQERCDSQGGFAPERGLTPATQAVPQRGGTPLPRAAGKGQGGAARAATVLTIAAPSLTLPRCAGEGIPPPTGLVVRRDESRE
jgi:hypothetical protein